mmetsp:Transcript_4674/g.8118  ORF Transcript_4674/g.8118 Transcript_4674/m.8118 type:complete len:127 (+) Transcript_4674:3835-4215(+)
MRGRRGDRANATTMPPAPATEGGAADGAAAPASAPELALSMNDERTPKKYRLMIRMKVPPNAVRHSMVKDSVEDWLIFLLRTNRLGRNKSGWAVTMDETEQGVPQYFARWMKGYQMRLPMKIAVWF